jgi:hypothetical protein
MSFELRFYGDDPKAVLGEVRALLNLGAIAEITTVKETVSDVLAPQPDATPAPRVRRAAKKDEPAQVDLEEAIAAKVSTPAPKPVTKDELRTKLIELMNAKGENVPSELLNEKFGVTKIGELDENQYGACFAAAVDALAVED